MEQENTVVKMIFGSHLYGTSSPESDKDYKGIYLPSPRELAAGKFKKCLSFNTKSAGSTDKNSKDDVDYEVYSLHYFIEMACQGEMFAFDMLHVPDSMIEQTSKVWQAIQFNKRRFYTKNLNAFVGYARRQAAKYEIKGSRLSAAKLVLEFLELQDPNLILREVWDQLPVGDHITKMADPENLNPVILYEVCGKKMQSTAKIKYCLPSLKKYYEQYGERAKLAANNEAIDWKAISHALRAALEAKEILTTNNLIFPLKDAAYLLEVKQGKLDYKSVVGPALENLMEELELLGAQSSLPEQADREYWDEYLYSIYFK